MHAFLTLVLCTTLVASAGAQTIITRTEGGQKVTTKTEGGRTMVRIEGGAFIPELGCALGDENGHVKVLHAMPASNRPKAYAGIDIQANDFILMANARTVKNAAAFRTLYEAAAPGDTITLGIKRGEAMQLASFVKMDPKDMPKNGQMIIRKTVK